MSNLKQNIEDIKTRYDNLQLNNIEENKKIKEMLKKIYTEKTNCSKMKELFSNFDNYEIYDTQLFTHPVVCIFRSEVLHKVYGNQYPVGSLNHFENSDRTEILYPVIIISDELYNLNNKLLLDYVISHELGHYRKNHVSTIYFEDTQRNILKEIEADLYACNILGVESCIAGLRELAIYILSDHPSGDIDEILKRLTFLSRKYNVSGVLNGFEIKKKNKE